MAKPLNPQDAIYYSAFVQAAYAMFSDDDTNLRPDPTGKGVPDGWHVVAWITMKDFFLLRQFEKFYGILAQEDIDSNSYVLAMRGTEEAIEWYNNAFAFLTPFDRVPGSGYVHQGFMRIYDTIKVTPLVPAAPAAPAAAAAAPAAAPAAAQPSGSFAAQIAQVVSERSVGGPAMALGQANANVVVVAHSLGAALATLYVMDNMANHTITNPLVCTFASPRVGDKTFVDRFNGFGLTSWRIANVPDLVPNLPPDTFSYGHVDTLTLVDSTGEVQPKLACAHAITTYDHMLDATRPVDAGCAVTPEEARLIREQLPDPATADQIRSAIEGVHAGDG